MMDTKNTEVTLSISSDLPQWMVDLLNWDSTFNGILWRTKNANIHSYLSRHKFQVKTRILFKSKNQWPIGVAICVRALQVHLKAGVAGDELV